MIERSRTQHIRTIEFANTYAWFGDKDNALKYLEKAIEEHNPLTAQIKVNPIYDGLRESVLPKPR